MTSAESTIWRNPIVETPEPEEGTGWRAPALWASFLVALVVARLFLPFNATDVMMTHERIVDSLLKGQNWGRQALVGSTEFPPLATLGLLLARLASPLFRVDAGRLLVACSQAWAFCYLLRTAVHAKRSWLVAACVGGLIWTPDVREAFLALDPNWIVAIPLCSATYHMAQWQRHVSLRDAVLCAVNCGLLAFASWIGIAFAFGMLAMLCHNLKRFPKMSDDDRGGVKLLLWTPFCYCLSLWLLWNWLIMGDMIFMLRRPWEALQSSDTDRMAAGCLRALGLSSPVVAGGCLVLVLCLGSPGAGAAMCLLSGALAVALARAVLVPVQVYAPAARLVALAVGLIGLTAPFLLLEWQRNWWRMLIGLGLLGAAGAAASLTPPARCEDDGAYAVPSPPAEAIGAWIDRFWPDSRVVVYGIRAPAIYHDPREKRFLAHLDFRKTVFLEQAADEQLHLLIPPPNGKFYARERGELSDIHRNGRPWLLLEKQWPSGWQLWRCVTPPAGESKLQELE